MRVRQILLSISLLALLAAPQASAAMTATVTAPLLIPVQVSATGLSASFDFVYGTCEGDSGNGRNYLLECGVDRDDDGFVTNFDLGGSTDPDGYDDDYADGASSGGKVSVPLCLRRDTAAGSGDWDNIHVRVYPLTGSPPPPASVTVKVTLTESATGCPNLINVSAHTHTTYL